MFSSSAQFFAIKFIEEISSRFYCSQSNLYQNLCLFGPVLVKSASFLQQFYTTSLPLIIWTMSKSLLQYSLFLSRFRLLHNEIIYYIILYYIISYYIIYYIILYYIILYLRFVSLIGWFFVLFFLENWELSSLCAKRRKSRISSKYLLQKIGTGLSAIG